MLDLGVSNINAMHFIFTFILCFFPQKECEENKINKVSTFPLKDFTIQQGKHMSKLLLQGFTEGSEGKSLPANAGTVPGLGATTTEAREPQSPCSAREATAMRSPHTTTREQPPLATTQEKPSQQRRPSTAKNKQK